MNYCIKVHDILHNACVQMTLGTLAKTLAHICNSAFQAACHEVWASQFSFSLWSQGYGSSWLRLACLVCINWSLEQAQQQSSIVLSQFFPLREVVMPGQRLGSISLCKRGLCQGLVLPLWLRGLTWTVGTETHPGGKKCAGGSVCHSCWC